KKAKMKAPGFWFGPRFRCAATGT
ncbi:hypothetical protein CCACVL1_04940, partial [Corchorus capsularis]